MLGWLDRFVLLYSRPARVATMPCFEKKEEGAAGRAQRAHQFENIVSRTNPARESRAVHFHLLADGGGKVALAGPAVDH